MPNVLMVIHPYNDHGTWVFDDEAVGLRREPFVAGIPEMIDRFVEGIPDARQGFRLTFSGQPFPGHQASLTRLREEHGGHWYRWDGTGMEGWLCPALFRYFEAAPERLFARADARAGA